DDEDDPDDRMIDALVAAQSAADADVVTAAVRPTDDSGGLQLFLGSPGALGLVQNQYGVLGLVRRAMVVGEPSFDGSVDPEWPLFARLALSGARIVSLPQALSTHGGKAGHVGDVPGDGLAVLHDFEKHYRGRPDMPQLAAILAAAHAGHRSASEVREPKNLARRSLALVHASGIGGVARSAGRRIRTLARGQQD